MKNNYTLREIDSFKALDKEELKEIFHRVSDHFIGFCDETAVFSFAESLLLTCCVNEESIKLQQKTVFDKHDISKALKDATHNFDEIVEQFVANLKHYFPIYYMVAIDKQLEQRRKTK